MPLLKGILHGRKITTDSGQQQDGGGGGLRRSNAVKHHGQQQQQQASAGGFDFPRREAVRTNTSPGLGSGGQAPMVAHARARATSSAAAQSGSEWSYVPANVQIRQHHGHGHSPGQREQLERRQELEDVHSQRTQRWVADQQKRMMLTPPVTRKPLPPQPPQSQSLPRPGGRPQIQQKPPQQQPQPTIPSSGSRRPFFKNDAELDDCVRSTSPPYEDGILNHGDWKTGKSVHTVQARRPVHVVTPSLCPVSRVASPVDEISDQREAARRALRRRNLPCGSLISCIAGGLGSYVSISIIGFSLLCTLNEIEHGSSIDFSDTV